MALLGSRSRRAATTWMWLSLGAAIAATVLTLGYGFTRMEPAVGTVVAAAYGSAFALMIGLLLLSAPLWYWLAIDFADEHGGWSEQAKQ
jgi:hypothetical protein